MIPLRLDVDEKYALKIQDLPQELKDEIEDRHKLLLNQVREVYTEKLHEFEAYIDRRAREFEANEEREALANEQNTSPTPKIKSIVKRQPSLATKRVSFSESPPRVELFQKDAQLSENRPVSLYPFPKPSKPQSVALSPTDGEPVRDEVAESADKLNGETGPDAKNDLREPIADPLRNDTIRNNTIRSASPIELRSPLGESLRNGSKELESRPSAAAIPRSPEIFPFEDLEPPSVPTTEDVNVDSHHAPFDSPLVSPDTSIEGRPPEDEPIVGSMPIDIATRPKTLELDGGLAPALKSDMLQQEAADRDLLETPSPSEANPMQMSFSQRMEWESMASLRKNAAKELRTE